jgi:hypothetical protein
MIFEERRLQRSEYSKEKVFLDVNHFSYTKKVTYVEPGDIFIADE